MLTFLKECDIISKLSTRDSENEIQVGMDCDEGPPVPIPNTEVKLIRADDTWLQRPGTISFANTAEVIQ